MVQEIASCEGTGHASHTSSTTTLLYEQRREVTAQNVIKREKLGSTSSNEMEQNHRIAKLGVSVQGN